MLLLTSSWLKSLVIERVLFPSPACSSSSSSCVVGVVSALSLNKKKAMSNPFHGLCFLSLCLSADFLLKNPGNDLQKSKKM